VREIIEKNDKWRWGRKEGMANIVATSSRATFMYLRRKTIRSWRWQEEY
jgi:hypothetical protein